MIDNVIGFSEYLDFNIPIKYLIEHLTSIKVLPVPPITETTLNIGSKNSPDNMSLIFKYNLGSFIELLDNGANILIKFKDNCYSKYYFKLQEQILEDLGYDFKLYYINDISDIYKVFKKINPNIKRTTYYYHLLLSFLMIKFIDKIDIYIRKNIGFEINNGSFIRAKNGMLNSFSKTNGYLDLIKNYIKFRKKIKNIKIDKPRNCIKIGIVGDLHTSIKQDYNYFIEKELSNMNIELTRHKNITFLKLVRKVREKYYLWKSRKYCKSFMNSVSMAKIFIDNGYDGIIHIKQFGCASEVACMKVLENLCDDTNTAFMSLTFDSHISELGIKTRLEAFYDMIKIKKEH